MQELIEWMSKVIAALPDESGPDESVGARNQMIIGKMKAESLLEKEKALHTPDVRLSLPTDEEIKQKAFDFSYVFRDDEDCKRSDAVETYCEEMGHWVKNKIQGNEAIVSHSKVEKPPLGLKPKQIHDHQRQGEIMAAIARYLEVGKTPPKEWVIEFASYCD